MVGILLLFNRITSIRNAKSNFRYHAAQSLIIYRSYWFYSIVCPAPHPSRTLQQSQRHARRFCHWGCHGRSHRNVVAGKHQNGIRLCRPPRLHGARALAGRHLAMEPARWRHYRRYPLEKAHVPLHVGCGR